MRRREINITQAEWREITARGSGSRAEQIQAARDMLDGILPYLTKRQRQVLEGRHWRGQTFQEIADELGIDKSVAHRHYQRAIKRARRQGE